MLLFLIYQKIPITYVRIPVEVPKFRDAGPKGVALVTAGNLVAICKMQSLLVDANYILYF